MRPTSLIDSLETRRLFAFVASGASTINGSEYQSIDQTVQLPDGSGYVSTGIFGRNSDFGIGANLQPRGESDVFLAFVKNGKPNIVAIGGESRQDLETSDDRADFAGDPRRLGERFLFGIDSRIRGADEYVSDMAFGPDGKLYVSLLFRREISLNTNNPRAPKLIGDGEYDLDYYDSAILRYDVSGPRLALEATMQIGGPFNDLVHDIDFDAAGNLYLGGRFERLANFGANGDDAIYNPVEGRTAGFVAKYTSDFELVYVSQFGGDSAEEDRMDAVYSIAVTDGGEVYAGGMFSRDADFDPRTGKRQRTTIDAEGKTDAFTLKLRTNGTLAWVRSQGGDGYDAVRQVVLTAGGQGIYNVGYFEDEADLNSDPEAEQIFRTPRKSDGDTDLFFTRFDADGNQLFVKPISGNGIELIASANVDSYGDLVLAGSFFGRADFDPSKRELIRTTPESDFDEDDNVGERDNAFSGFVAVYGATGKLRRSTQIDGRENEDVFITTATMNDDNELSVSGRYRGMFRVPGTGLTVRTRGDTDDTKEDGYTLVLRSDLSPIV